MRAIVLVGGQGTRLRPLTTSLPKALVPIAGQPLIDHLLRHLCRYGINDVTLATTEHNRPIERYLGDGREHGMHLSYAYEAEPAGSGGAIRDVVARWAVEPSPGSPFLVLNGDVLCDIDLSEFARDHAERQAQVSLALVEVSDPSRYGVTLLDPERRVTAFIEKPARGDAPSHWINAGLWLFQPEVVSRISDARFSRVEDELFPQLAQSGDLAGFPHDGYWADVGTIESYWMANMEVLGREAGERGSDVVVDPSAMVDRATLLEGPVVVGPASIVEAGATVRQSVVWGGVRIGEGATVERAILTTGARLERDGHVTGAVLQAPDGSASAPAIRF